MEPADELRAASPRPELTVTQAGTYCRLVRFTITSDTTVTPDYPDNTCAGSNSGLLARRLVGQQMGWSAASGRTLTVPIRIENRTQYAVQLPIRIELPTNNKKVIIPFEHTNTAIVPLNMDSTLGNGTKVWLVGGSGMLGSGDTSVVHNLTFQVDTPVVKAELWFVLKGEEQDSFPAVAPSFRPAFFNADTSYNSTSILKRVLRVRFHDTATTNARATAVDSVAGEVIGGDGENFYYIFVPTATSTAQLDSARATLKRQPAVRAALPVLQPLFINGRRPNDGSGFNPDDWTFIPDSSSGWSSPGVVDGWRLGNQAAAA